MPCLSNLASYLERERNLEADNQPSVGVPGVQNQIRGWGHYFKIIENLRAPIFTSSVGNAHTILQIDSA